MAEGTDVGRAQRLAIAVAAALALVATGLWLSRDAIAERVMAGAFDRAMGDPFAGLPDGLSVALCGSGSPMPDPTRAGP
jgi:ribonuclease Z